MHLPPIIQQLDILPEQLGVILIDHGSRRAESNAMLEKVVSVFRDATGLPIVEPAHMELAEPSLEVAFARCVDQGADTVVVFPYFLGPGRHWDEDIPRLAADAARKHQGVRYLVTAPLGVDERIAAVISDRIAVCLRHTLAEGPACDACEQQSGCAKKSRP